MTRSELIRELVTIIQQTFPDVNEEKIRNVIGKYTTEEIERVLDMCYRFPIDVVFSTLTT